MAGGRKRKGFRGSNKRVKSKAKLANDRSQKRTTRKLSAAQRNKAQGAKAPSASS